MLVALTIVLWWGTAPAYAATITVTTTADESNTSGSGTGCSLREAVRAANTDAAFGGCPAGSGIDEIRFDPSTNGTPIILAIAVPSLLAGEVRIVGNGAENTIVDGNKGIPLFYLSFGVTAEIAGLTLRNGHSDPASFDGGGAIRNGGNLTISDSVLTGNTSGNVFGTPGNGGAIWNIGHLTLVRTTLSDNGAVGGAGGAIYTKGASEGGTVTLIHSTLTGNRATGSGGGAIFNDLGGQLSLSETTVDGNEASFGRGGGISNVNSQATIAASIIRRNTASNSSNTAGNGGGIFASGVASQLSITDSIISENAVHDDGAGLYSTEGSTVTILRSTISGNIARRDGGGIFITSTTFSLTNSTLSGNRALSSGGGIFQDGGPQLTISHTTVSGNSAERFGGGVFWRGFAVNLVASVFDTGASGTNCLAELGGVPAVGGSNVSDDGSCFSNGGSNKVVADVKLGPLADNGGFTPTHALLTGSPAIDAVVESCGVSTDQRGQPRPIDGDSNGSAVCDSGAFEAPAGTTPPPPPTACSPRPSVRLQPQGQTAPGALTYTVTLSSLSNGGANHFERISFDGGSNATVELPGHAPRAPGFEYVPGPGTSATFTVRRVNPGAFTVNLTVVDACGPWKSFAGGGPNVP